MDINKLKMIIADDDSGLLKLGKKSTARPTTESLLKSKFQEIVNFSKHSGHAPTDNKDNINEYQLFCRLERIKENNDHVLALLANDELGLLEATKTFHTLNDIFLDDTEGLLEYSEPSIFNLKHIAQQRSKPDYVAQRKPCHDFEKFEKMFKTCHAHISSGNKSILPFMHENQIKQGQIFILKGLLVYVDHIGEQQKRNGIVNARLRCIFENGTESNMLLRSFARRLYEGGGRVIS